MKHEELKSNDIVLFKRYSEIFEKEIYQDGNVAVVHPDRKTVSIIWLTGYKSMVDDVPYEKVIAKYDKNGEHMKFEEYSGNSILLDN